MSRERRTPPTTREEILARLRFYLTDPEVLHLAVSHWQNERSRTKPMYELFDEIQPMIDRIEGHGGAGREGLPLVSAIENALDVYAKGAEHGTAGVSATALEAFVRVVVQDELAKAEE